MRIGINALLLSAGANYRRTGVSRYIDGLLHHLPAEAGDDELIVYVDRGIERLADGLELRQTPFSVRKPPIRIGWELTALSLAARRDRLDVFHGALHVIPPVLHCPAAVTVHDLAFLRYPEQVTAKRYHYLKRMIGFSARRSDAVIVPSESTGNDVVELLGVDPGRIAVVPLGVSSEFQPAGNDDIQRVRSKYGLTAPYVLALGTIEPRKNLPRLVNAMAQLGDSVAEDLVIAGPTGWLTDEVEKAIANSGLGARIRRTGYIDDGDLAPLYSGATVVAIPSLYEGFGLPVLEAMASGAAVVTSNVSSMPEVAGDAAELVNPHSVDEIATAIRSLIDSACLRTRLKERAVIRAREFTWSRTARETMAVYRSIG
jgi:glycosyltransferase involved in cell wall biosynthesis